MGPQTRRRAKSSPEMAVSSSDSDNESSSSSSDEEEAPQPESESEEEEEEEEESVKMETEEEEKEANSNSKRKGKATITIRLSKVCKVCRKPGHEAGFRGATYIDCPMKPCFLCKIPGHTTMNCPHKAATEHGMVPAPWRNSGSSLDYVFQRQIRPRIPPIKPAHVIPNELCHAALKYHSRRVTCLEFHPTKNNILLSGDKKGRIGLWDFEKVDEKMVYSNIHSCLVNNMRFDPKNECMIYAASSDGTISCTDLETGIASSLVNLNPNGWEGRNSWRMLYGMDVNPEKGVIIVSDNFGCLYMVDTRSNSKVGDSILIHKRGTKVVGLHCNPVQPDLLLSCGNDYYARIWDMRHLEAGSSIYDLLHKRVVNSAYFSPLSGNKILSTCQDNRIRVWDSIFGNMDSPSREIVHSHDFNRHLTPFRAEWDPKDPSESLAVIGRYISENINGAALHPIDFIDVSTGQLVAEVMDPNVETITPVTKLHPRDDVLASGSSRSLFIWRPKQKSEQPNRRVERQILFFPSAAKNFKGKSKGGSDDDSDDDDDDFMSNGKKLKSGKNLKSGKSESKSAARCPRSSKR